LRKNAPDFIMVAGVLRFATGITHPRGLMILKGTVTVLTRGSWHTVPTYFVGSRGQTFPSVVVVTMSIKRGLVIQIKQQQRQQALARRDAMVGEVRASASQKLTDYQAFVTTQPKGKIISGFWPIRSEIDPRPLMFLLAEKGAVLALPALIDKGGEKIMIFRTFKPNQDLVPMGFDTWGPGPDADLVDPDIVLLPLAAFDAQGNRIGYGGGFYDRTVAQMRAHGLTPQLTGLAFDCQEVTNIAAEPHDIRLDGVLTESGPRYFDKRQG